MKRRIIEPNLLLSVDKVENNKDNVGELFCRNTENEEIKVSLFIEKDETVKRFDKSDYKSASKEDWNVYLKSLVEANFDEEELKKDYLMLMTKKADEVDAKIEKFEDIEATRDLTDEESSELKKLKQEKRELRQAKEDPSQFLEERKVQVQKQIDNKKLFMFGGITRKLNEDRTPSYSVEIPHPDKKVRNIKSPRNGIVVDYTLVNQLDGGKEILTLGNVKDPNFNYDKVRLESRLTKINTKENIENVFMINENAIDKIIGNEKYGNMFYTNRLLNVYSNNDLAKDLYNFRKNNSYENLNVEDIEKLKEMYNKIKEDILTNGMEGYDISIVIQANKTQIKSLAEQFATSLENGLLNKVLPKEETVPSEIKLEKITGVQSIPTNIVNGVNLADQWYAATSFATNIFPAAKETISKKEIEMFGSVKILEQVDQLCGIEVKKNGIKQSDQEVEDVNGMER